MRTLSTRNVLVVLMFVLAALSTVACDGKSGTSTPQTQHSEYETTNPDGSHQWQVQTAPAYEPPSNDPNITAPCIACLVGHDNGPAINVGGGVPVPNTSACQQNPTLVGCPANP